jgi:type IV secretory pathway VirB10-like protein
MPDGYAMSLQTTPGLSPQGQGGLTGEVNTHWASKLGWSLAVGAIEGLSSGAIGFGTNSNSSVIFRQPGQEMSQLFQGILNRPASVKIPAGTRIKIILLEDLNGVPEYDHHQMRPGVL